MLYLLKWFASFWPKAQPLQPTIDLVGLPKYKVRKDFKAKYICWAYVKSMDGSISVVGNPAFIESVAPVSAALEYFHDFIPEDTKSYCSEHNIELIAQSKLCPND